MWISDHLKFRGPSAGPSRAAGVASTKAGLHRFFRFAIARLFSVVSKPETQNCSIKPSWPSFMAGSHRIFESQPFGNVGQQALGSIIGNLRDAECWVPANAK